MVHDDFKGLNGDLMMTSWWLMRIEGWFEADLMENLMVIWWGLYGDFMEKMMHWGLFLGDFCQGFDGDFSWDFLVGGWQKTLWKMMEFVSWDDDIPNIWKKWKMFQGTNQILLDMFGISMDMTKNIYGYSDNIYGYEDFNDEYDENIYEKWIWWGYLCNSRIWWGNLWTYGHTVMRVYNRKSDRKPWFYHSNICLLSCSLHLWAPWAGAFGDQFQCCLLSH